MNTYVKVLICLLLALGLMFYMGFAGPWLVNQKSTVTLFAAPVVFLLYVAFCAWSLSKMFKPRKENPENV